MQPVELNCVTSVALHVHDAQLCCCGPLLCHATLTVRSATTKYAETAAATFTDHPRWDAPLTFDVVDPKEELFVEIRDALTSQFLGTCPLGFALNTPSRSHGPARWMLLPRGVGDGTGDANDAVPEDMATLAKYREDDFGYVTVEWDARQRPIGPECLRDAPSTKAPSAGTTAHTDPTAASCAVAASWLSAAATAPAGTPGAALASGSVTVRFGPDPSAEVVTLRPGVPQHLALHGGAGDTARFSVWGHSADGAPAVLGEASLRLPTVKDTECSVLLPLRPVTASPVALALGYLAVRVLVSSQALQGYRQAPPPGLGDAGNGRAPPDVEGSLLSAAVWESHEHAARSTERRWKRSVALDAQPQPEHVRHLYDVVTGTAALHTALLPVVTAFFNLPQDCGDAACDLRPLLVAMLFACPTLEPRRAALFAFEALAPAGEPAPPPVDLIAYVLEHCLLPRTLDLTAADIRRRATDLAASHQLPAVTVAAFDAAVAQNAALWLSCGCALAGGVTATPAAAASAVQGQAHASASLLDDAAKIAASAPDQSRSGDAGSWRHFVVRSAKTKKKFAVTAHETDTFKRVAKQVEQAVGVPVAKQRLRLPDQSVLEMGLKVGQVIQWSPQPVQEVEVEEQSDDVTVLVVWREKGKKWHHTLSGKEKVLRLRAHVQQKTMIPLSRVVVAVAGTTLWDRHTLAHYGIADGTVIEVKTQ